MPTSYEMLSIERTRVLSSALIGAQTAWRNIVRQIRHEYGDLEQPPLTSEQFAQILDTCFSHVEQKVIEAIQGLCTEREAFELFFLELEKHSNLLPFMKTHEFFRVYANYLFVGMMEIMSLRMAPSVVSGMLGIGLDES